MTSQTVYSFIRQQHLTLSAYWKAFWRQVMQILYPTTNTPALLATCPLSLPENNDAILPTILAHAKTLTTTQWTLDETANISPKVKIVEVEFFPEEEEGQEPSFTSELDDPNLKITHTPSDRLH